MVTIYTPQELGQPNEILFIKNLAEEVTVENQ